MSRILFVYERAMPTVSILRECFCDLPAAYGMDAEFLPLLSVTAGDIDRHDVLYLIRPDNIFSPKLAKLARGAGKFVVVSLDDDLLNLPEENPAVPWRTAGLRKALQNADALISSSPHILEKYRHLTRQKRGARIDTVVNSRAFSPEREEKTAPFPVKIVYAANPSHASLFNRYILPVMDSLAARYPQKLSFTFVGVRPELPQYEDVFSIQYIPGMPLGQYRAFMEQAQFDLGLAPLHDSEFARCKYFNKYLEYTLSGITGVYSAVEPYTTVVEDGSNGFLAYNTESGWLDALCRAIDNPTGRSRCLRRARQHLQQDFSESAVLRRLTDQIPELAAPPKDSCRKCPSLAPLRMLYRLSRPVDMLYLSAFYLRRGGFSGFFQKVKSHLRDRRAYQTRPQRKGGFS